MLEYLSPPKNLSVNFQEQELQTFLPDLFTVFNNILK